MQIFTSFFSQYKIYRNLILRTDVENLYPDENETCIRLFFYQVSKFLLLFMCNKMILVKQMQLSLLNLRYFSHH